MMNRRRHARHECIELASISTKTRRDRVGLVRDLSATGLRFDSISKFAVDECVELFVHLPAVGARTMSGRVVRSFVDADNTSLYPHSAALEFDSPRFDL